MKSQLDWYAQQEPGQTCPARRVDGSIRLLCTGDIHLGRRSSRLPAHADPAALSTAGCWSALAELAIERGVHAVLLSGDVVDRANRYFEAFGPLESGLRRLSRSGIPTFAVAGNHDFDVLPRLVDSFDDGMVRLLGRDGRWERETLWVDRRPVLHLDGWSFPSEHVTTDPLTDYRPGSTDDLPVVGLLHADLDQPASRYGPTSLAALRARRNSCWVLGHVHQPTLIDRAAGPAVLYPGSPQALDPGEPGPHGAWLVELGRTGTRFELVPLSGVRYDTLEVELPASGAASGDPDVEAIVAGRVLEHLAAVSDEPGRLAHLSLRLRVTGRARRRSLVATRVGQLVRELEPSRGRVTAFVERLAVETRPEVDIEALARGSDPPAVLARLLLGLDRGEPEAEELVRAAELQGAEVRNARPYLSLGAQDADSPVADSRPETRDVLRRQAMALLDELLAQKES
jgi:DNA repair protein SbcD/Mre11